MNCCRLANVSTNEMITSNSENLTGTGKVRSSTITLADHRRFSYSGKNCAALQSCCIRRSSASVSLDDVSSFIKRDAKATCHCFFFVPKVLQ